jgi:hypothetical protein
LRQVEVCGALIGGGCWWPQRLQSQPLATFDNPPTDLKYASEHTGFAIRPQQPDIKVNAWVSYCATLRPLRIPHATVWVCTRSKTQHKELQRFNDTTVNRWGGLMKSGAEDCFQTAAQGSHEKMQKVPGCDLCSGSWCGTGAVGDCDYQIIILLHPGRIIQRHWAECPITCRRMCFLCHYHLTSRPHSVGLSTGSRNLSRSMTATQHKHLYAREFDRFEYFCICMYIYLPSTDNNRPRPNF